MTKCIADITVKLSVVGDGAVDIVIDKFLWDIFFPNVCVELKAKRSDYTLHVAVAIVVLHAAYATALADSAPLPTLFPNSTPPARPTPVSSTLAPVLYGRHLLHPLPT